MKYLKLLLLIIFIPIFAVGQSTYKELTANGHMSTIICTHFSPIKIKYDYKNCQLTIKSDSLDGKLSVTTTITNNSDDTLRYGWESDCWIRYYSIDNKYLTIEGLPAHCIHNIPYTVTVLPHKSKATIIYVERKGIGNFNGKFKIGFFLLLKRDNGIDEFGINGFTSKKVIKQFDRDMKKRSHTIWSNALEI